MFQHTAARRRLASGTFATWQAGRFQHTAARRRLVWVQVLNLVSNQFQHTAARRRLDEKINYFDIPEGVSTHSRPKAAGFTAEEIVRQLKAVSTHSRPKAAGAFLFVKLSSIKVSTHSRPKAAGASLKSLAPSGFTTPISLSSQEKREREYNTAFSVAPAFAIS
ncbi:hypothetical protein NEIMUCOT_06409 [Neisseria mucosa ATCC 25996]|uniref:Uncharacterized protein n=1 Tax=Neisseria mucosa (strain ATCC 25996 / DSM 4631 / NCTC 10774 / M26) TaxID=546266 RepID=D3A0H3_NEIM2|nr:hypothetical protein NEIMUCOT_06409 [Neisseria mucosa ATCC 25996]